MSIIKDKDGHLWDFISRDDYGHLWDFKYNQLVYDDDCTECRRDLYWTLGFEWLYILNLIPWYNLNI